MSASILLNVFCWIPGGTIGAAFIGPLLILFIPPGLNFIPIICFISILMSIMFIGGANFLNSKDYQKTDWGRGSLSAFIIYYSICFILIAFIKTALCKVVDYIPV